MIRNPTGYSNAHPALLNGMTDLTGHDQDPGIRHIDKEEIEEWTIMRQQMKDLVERPSLVQKVKARNSATKHGALKLCAGGKWKWQGKDGASETNKAPGLCGGHGELYGNGPHHNAQRLTDPDSQLSRQFQSYAFVAKLK